MVAILTHRCFAVVQFSRCRSHSSFPTPPGFPLQLPWGSVPPPLSLGFPFLPILPLLPLLPLPWVPLPSRGSLPLLPGFLPSKWSCIEYFGSLLRCRCHHSCILRLSHFCRISQYLSVRFYIYAYSDDVTEDLWIIVKLQIYLTWFLLVNVDLAEIPIIRHGMCALRLRNNYLSFSKNDALISTCTVCSTQFFKTYLQS